MSLRTAIRTPRPLAPQRKRRRIVAATGIGWSLMVLGAVLTSGSGEASVLGHFVNGFGLGMTFAVYLMLMMPWKLGLPSLKGYQADERQHLQLLQAYTLAYRVIGVAVLLGAMYLLIGSDEGTRLPLPHTREQWYPVFWAAILLVGALPTAILAWTEPDFDDGGQA